MESTTFCSISQIMLLAKTDSMINEQIKFIVPDNQLCVTEVTFLSVDVYVPALWSLSSLAL